MARRQENILEQLYELTGFFWPVGLVVTIIMLAVTGFSIGWCLNLKTSGFVGEALAPIFLVRWLIPAISFGLTLFFANKTYITWENSRS